MAKTLECIQDPEQMNYLTAQAKFNLQKWSQTTDVAPRRVDVVHEDWGQTTQKASQAFGQVYTVLNLANPYFPGGACFSGGSAQEENMWHRSNCALSLLETGVEYDQSCLSFIYQEDLKRLVLGQERMSKSELNRLQQRCPNLSFNDAYKVMLSNQLRICFRGPEVFLHSTPDQFQAKDYISDELNSFVMLPSSEIFPFYELRSAAPPLKSPSGLNTLDIDNLRRRIKAQLDTLILHDHTHVVLGAWGCGEFKNNPEIVAKLYREEIEKRARFFHHILFPIISLGTHNQNFSIFKKYLDGLELGPRKNMFLQP